MKQSFVETSVITQVTLPEGKLEQFFSRHDTNRNEKTSSDPKNYKDLEWSAAETTARGIVQIVLVNRGNRSIQCVEMPIAARFFVAATRTADTEYKIAYGASLS